MGDGDPAAIGIIASALTDPELGYKNIISDYSFLRTAADKMSLPKDYESLQPLHNAIAYFEGKEPTALLHNEYNHPIDWALVRQIPAKQQAIITTTKGQITMQLFVEEAPGSVGNFVALVRQQYFNGKYFHRVVPNFVVQTGCNRGDGWGSEDYSIRSEFSLRRYKTGSVGMASAGKDTEGTQWFITHSPTPHLDGRYSLFAEVTAGLDVLHQIEVGDKIINIDLK
jgi:cyclophilin family peptidyl-prolyl cis-trans isomerase